MYIEDFRRLLQELGCLDFRAGSGHAITLDDPEVEAKVGMIDFRSITIRAFKLSSLEDLCEDYGQVAIYRRKSSMYMAPPRKSATRVASSAWT